MNKILLRQITILSVILGIGLAIFTLIPFVGTFAFIALMCFASTLVIVTLVKLDFLEILSIRESVVLGALIGFISFLAFSVVYLPIVALLGRFFSLGALYGISMLLNVGSFGIILMFTVFVAILSATINAFTAFITFYVMEFLKTLDKNSSNNDSSNDKFNLR